MRVPCVGCVFYIGRCCLLVLEWMLLFVADPAPVPARPAGVAAACTGGMYVYGWCSICFCILCYCLRSSPVCYISVSGDGSTSAPLALPQPGGLGLALRMPGVPALARPLMQSLLSPARPLAPSSVLSGAVPPPVWGPGYSQAMFAVPPLSLLVDSIARDSGFGPALVRDWPRRDMCSLSSLWTSCARTLLTARPLAEAALCRVRVCTFDCIILITGVIMPPVTR